MRLIQNTLHRMAGVLVLLTARAATVQAHPGHQYHDATTFRNWTDDTGFFQIRATFVMASDGKAQVRKQDDSLMMLPIERLCDKDQVWIKKRLSELRSLNTRVADLLHPVPAKRPMSAKTNFFRGAIALAVNGVPIFNPIKNDGRTDTLLAGELDKYGGHCGRGDDYHYHIAPVHLEKKVGKGKPLAYALDGYPIYGYEEADGSKVKGLDGLNGHKDAAGHYHYHATKTYPYINGGFYGEVVERGGQVDPQPRAQPLRPPGRPLRGAKITEFTSSKPNSYRLTYELRGEKRHVEYTIDNSGAVTFKFIDPSGRTTTTTYRPRRN